MKKSLLFFASMVVILTAAPVMAAPAFKAQETIYNFPSAPEGKTVKHTFIFSNGGDKELRILKVTTGCSCTAASFTDRLMPGEEGTIDVTVNTMGYAGMNITQPVTLTTNDPANKEVKLLLRGPVTRFAMVEPDVLVLQGMEGEAIEGSVRIRPYPGHPFQIKNAKVRYGTDFRFEILTEDGGKTYSIKAKNIREKVGTYYDLITLEIDSPVRKDFPIRVHGNVQTKKAKP